MATDIDAFRRELRGFADRKVVLRELRKGIREPFPAVRKRIRATAVDILPHKGGLNEWAARIRITLSVKVSGRRVRVTVSGGRNSRGGVSDIRALDRGRVRHPSWGRKGPGEWHTEQVPDGFFTDTVADSPEWLNAVDASFDRALDTIRRG